MVDELKKKCVALSDADLLDLFDCISSELKRRNESTLGSVVLSDDPIADLKRAFESLGIGVDNVYDKKSRRR